MMVASIIFGVSFFTESQIHLQKEGGLIFLRRIIGAIIVHSKEFDDTTGDSKLFLSSVV